MISRQRHYSRPNSIVACGALSVVLVHCVLFWVSLSYPQPVIYLLSLSNSRLLESPRAFELIFLLSYGLPASIVSYLCLRNSFWIFNLVNCAVPGPHIVCCPQQRNIYYIYECMYISGSPRYSPSPAIIPSINNARFVIH